MRFRKTISWARECGLVVEHLPNMYKALGSLSRTMYNHEVKVGSCFWVHFLVTVLPVTPELKHICYVTHFLTRPCCMYRLIFIN